MKKKFNLFGCLVVAVSLSLSIGFVGCSDSDDDEEYNNVGGINKSYKINRSSVLTIDPLIEGFSGGTFTWIMSRANNDSIIGKNSKLEFISLTPGEYKLVFAAQKGNIERRDTTMVLIEKEAAEYSPYISKVYDYLPAIGQFVNSLPRYEDKDTKEAMIQKAQTAIAGPNSSMIHLGGFGGYVVFGFDHTVMNVEGKRDFRVKGNAFWSAGNPNPEAPGRGGSCEPGIVMVAYDKNKNGKPDDDEWYEIAGSEYYKATTIKNYEITYYRPEVEKPGALKEYVKWEDNQGKSGYKEKNGFHAQSYYPLWVSENKITFKGTLLPNNAIDESGEGNYWVLYSYPWGYVDNAPNNDNESAIDINWAVDSNGAKVSLPGIDFVKVYTGVNQEAGWLGEVSTEVAGAEDLHLRGISIYTRNDYSK